MQALLFPQLPSFQRYVLTATLIPYFSQLPPCAQVYVYIFSMLCLVSRGMRNRPRFQEALTIRSLEDSAPFSRQLPK